MLHLGQEPAFGQRGLLGRRVAAVQQALEHHPAVAEVPVHAQVDPAEPAVGQAAEHLVLPADQLSGGQLGHERERCPAVRAVPLGQPGLPVPAPGPPGAHTSRRTACSPVPAGWPGWRRPDHGPAPAGCPPGRRPAARGRTGCCRAGTAGCRTAPTRTRCRCCRTRRRWARNPAHRRHLAGPVARPPDPSRRRPGPGRGRCLRRDRRCRRRRPGQRRGQPAHGAVPAVDGAGAPGPGARGRGHGHFRCLRLLSARTACW